MNPILTGKILPRDYGVELRLSQRRKVFFSPLKYAIAKLMLETSDQVKKRLETISQERGTPLDELVEALGKGVKKRHRTKVILNKDRRDILRGTHRYGLDIAARVQSKRRGSKLTKITFGENEELAYLKTECHCEDVYWDGTKRYEAICTHLAVLEEAIYLDNQTKQPRDDNLTGLLPRERPLIQLPFRLLSVSRRDEILDPKVTKMILDYYVEGKNFYEINKNALKDPQIFTSKLVKNLRSPWQKARFVVLSQEEKKKSNPSPQERVLYGSIKAVERRITGMLRERGFYRDGFGVEFQGTDHEIVGRRFRSGSEVYSICIGEDLPPVIVHKFLGSQPRNIFQSHDGRNDHPLLRENESYESIDDTTRRFALTKVILPGRNERSEVFVSQNLARLYTQLRDI